MTTGVQSVRFSVPRSQVNDGPSGSRSWASRETDRRNRIRVRDIASPGLAWIEFQVELVPLPLSTTPARVEDREDSSYEYKDSDGGPC